MIFKFNFDFNIFIKCLMNVKNICLIKFKCLILAKAFICGIFVCKRTRHSATKASDIDDALWC